METILEKELDYNHKSYNFKAYIQKDYMIFQLESDTKKYSNKYKLEDLIELDKYFSQFSTLEEALDDLNDIIKDYLIEEKGNYIILLIQYKKKKLKFILDEIDDNYVISYDSLSDNMKKIIKENQLILGIDLGTTYSCAAVMIDNKIIIIRNSLGSTTLPSYISLINKNDIYVGELAKILPSNEKNVIFNIKRLLGKNLEDKEIKEIKNNLPFNLQKDEKFNLLKILINFNDNSEEAFYPEQIYALILKKIIKDSEYYLSKKIGKDINIKNVVLTVPAYFNQKQREATLNSAKIIGLNVKTMINEPTAASLAYAYQSLENTDKRIVIIDFGGGTLDITLLRYRKDREAIYCDVKFTYGNTNFGGEDFDNQLMKKCIEKCINEDKTNSEIYKNTNKNNPYNIRLKRACERAKIKLSFYDSTEIHIENYVKYKSINISIKRDEFIEYCKELFMKFEQILDDFIIQSKMKKDDISEVILIGGSILIPKIKEIITKKFNNSKIKDDLDPKEVVAMGASVRGAKISNLTSVKDIKLFDVTNLSLGIRIIGNKFSRIIERSTPIPFKNKGVFETVEDNQTEGLIEVYEGEGNIECDKKNLLLGNFIISGLPKRKAGESKIEVELEIKDNSILNASAFDLSNKLNYKELVIKKQIDFLTIIDDLIEREKFFIFIENSNYNDIKFSIIELEEKITQFKNKKIINKESIKLAQKNIIEKIGIFLKDYHDNEHLNIYISFIKYYFNKICEFYQEYNIGNKDDDLKLIKENFINIFEKLQINNKYIIFEIIEEFIDIDNIYISFMDFILNCHYEEIYTIFYLTNSKKKENKSEKLDEALNELSEAKKLANISVEIIDKFQQKEIKFNKTKTDFENIKLKLQVRIELLTIKKKNFFEKFVFLFWNDYDCLKKLYTKYSKCPILDEEDLKELSEQINISTEPSELEKFTRFSSYLGNLNINSLTDITNIIFHILSIYPYHKDKIENKRMWDEYYEFKAKRTPEDIYLLLIKDKYTDIKNSNILSKFELDAYDRIIELLNEIKLKKNY